MERRKQIYVEVVNKTFSNQITVNDVQQLLTDNVGIVKGSDFIETQGGYTVFDKWKDSLSICISRTREETDEEFELRTREIPKPEPEMVCMKKEVFEEMKDKAWKYDQLCSK